MNDPARRLATTPPPFEVPRHEPRYRLQIPVTLMLGKQALSLTTEDISFSGLFLRTDELLPVRGLIRFQVPIEGRGEPLSLTGMVVHVVAPDGGSGRVPGVGVRLYGIGGTVMREWVDFAKALRARYPNSEQRPVRVAPQPEDVEMVRRREQRFAATLEVRLSTVEELHVVYTRDISRGGMFIATELPLSMGDAVFVELVHPETDQVFGMACVVRRATREGVGVEFEHLSDGQRQSLAEFIEPLADLAYDDIVIVDGP